MRKIGRIVLAWWYWVTNKNNWLSKERLQHCAHCEFRVWFVCGECGCPLQAKSRDMEEECPKGKWPILRYKLKTPGNYQQPGA